MGEKVGFTFIGFSHIRQYAGTPFRHHIVTPSSCILPVKGAISATVVPLTINCLASMGALMKKKVFDKKHFHFKAKQGAYVALFPSTEVWEIENISLKGLSFWYIPRGEPPEDPTQIDIFVKNETFYLKCVPSKIVSDSPVKMDSNEDLPWRRQTVEFGKMKPTQQTVLKSFLEMYI